MAKRNGFVQSLLTVVLIAAFISPSQAATNDDDQSKALPLKDNIGEPSWIADLEAFIPKIISEAGVPGLSIAVTQGSEIVWYSNFGTKSSRTDEAINDSTVFQAASLSKTCFAYLVMKLVDEGRFALDTPLVYYYPKDYIKNDDRDRLITARMVLSHTTGFPNWRPRESDLKMHFAPGEKFSYSGEGYVYLQKTVEQITGQSLARLMKDYVLEPLGMRHSSYEWREEYEANYAVGHAEFGVAIDRKPMTEGSAAFSLYTTAIDYAKFLIAMQNETGLTRESIEEMLTPQVQLDEECLNCTNRAPSKLSDVNAWGLGWGLQTTDQGTSFWHWGDQGIYRCYTMVFKKQQIGLVYFTNSENGLAIRDELVDRAIGGHHPAFSWLRYDSYKSLGKKVIQLVVHQGLDAGMALFDSLKAENPNASAFSERTLNRLGYHFVRSKQFDKAIIVLKLNVQEYPDSWNVYDSLAEAYVENGQEDLAVSHYEKSLTLNPDNVNGKKKLEELSKE
jgi:CubicO group peptidase (beta-lactamase class C family)